MHAFGDPASVDEYFRHEVYFGRPENSSPYIIHLSRFSCKTQYDERLAIHWGFLCISGRNFCLRLVN